MARKPTDKVSIAEQVFEWIECHPYVRLALKKGLVNYSSLAREIQSELSIKNFDAMIVAIRRHYEKLQKVPNIDPGKIRGILNKSQLEIRTAINVYILKGETPPSLSSSHYSHLIRGSKFSVVITDMKLDIGAEKHEGLVEVRIRSPEDIETEPGSILEIYQKLFEHGINIVETYSCYIDTVVIVEKRDILKTIKALSELGIQ